MKIYLLPKTRLGKWSAILLGVLVLMLIVTRILVATGQQGGEDFFSNLAISVPMALAVLAGVAAFFTGVFGITISRERSVLVFICAFIGFFVMALLVGELVSPH